MKLVNPNLNNSDIFLASYKQLPNQERVYFTQFLGVEINHSNFFNFLKTIKRLSASYDIFKLWWLIDDKQYIGRSNVRKKRGFDSQVKIGYFISPAFRGKGYGTKILKLCLDKVRKMGIRSVFLHCQAANIASQKVILKNGGKLVRKYTTARNQAKLEYIIRL